MRKSLLPQKKIFVLILIVVTFTSTAVLWQLKDFAFGSHSALIGCFHQAGNKMRELQDNEPILGPNIFFHETSCPSDTSDVFITARQACSVESALLANPDTDVFLLITSPINTTLSGIRNILVRQLLSYPNMKLRHINFFKYLRGTPLEWIVKSGALNSSLWPVSHASDILRYATLYKFGGTYLDLDVFVIKSLKPISNFAGAESNTSVGSGIINFGKDLVGREMGRECVEELARTFDGQVWGTNGPGVITRVLSRRCFTQDVWSMRGRTCRGFHIHPAESFNAVPFWEVDEFFTKGNLPLVQKLLNQSYTIHFWNKFSSNFYLDPADSQGIPFLNYAKKYCPKVYNATKAVF